MKKESTLKKNNFVRCMASLLSAIIIVVSLLHGNVTSVNAKSQTVSGTACYDYANEVLRLLNIERGKHGLAPLEMDIDLMRAATTRCAECSIVFDHTRPDGSSCFSINDKVFGENIAWGYSTPQAVLDGWMNSPGHRDNILSASYKTIGIGCTNINGRLYWCQLFGYGNLNAGALTERMQFTFEISLGGEPETTTKAPTVATTTPTKAPTVATTAPTKAPTVATTAPTKAPTVATTAPTKAPTVPQTQSQSQEKSTATGTQAQTDKGTQQESTTKKLTQIFAPTQLQTYSSDKETGVSKDKISSITITYTPSNEASTKPTQETQAETGQTVKPSTQETQTATESAKEEIKTVLLMSDNIPINSYKLKKGMTLSKLSICVVPTPNRTMDFTVTSMDKSVASFENGELKINGYGRTTIVIKSSDSEHIVQLDIGEGSAITRTDSDNGLGENTEKSSSEAGKTEQNNEKNSENKFDSKKVLTISIICLAAVMIICIIVVLVGKRQEKNEKNNIDSFEE